MTGIPDLPIHLDPAAPDYATLYGSFRWQVPARFNIASAVCGRWAADRARFALYFEDESGATSAWSFHDIQAEANRLSNVLAALGVLPGDRVAILLPQRPETAIAYVAILQMGAIAVPFSHLFGPDAIGYRLADAGISIAIVEETTWPKLEAALGPAEGRAERFPAFRHMIGTDDVKAPGVRRWADVLEHASPRHPEAQAKATLADDPALIIYTSGTTGNPKGALIPHRALIGNLPGFVCSHDFYPQAGDMFWSPADWAWTGGLFDALLPTWFFGQPILGYSGRFDAGKAFRLIEKYRVRNAFLFPTALKLMMKAYPDPKAHFDLDLRSVMSAGEPLGEAVFTWAKDQLGVTINEMFGQTELNYVVGGCASRWPARAGAMGRPYPGHEVALLDLDGRVVPAGETGVVGEIAVRRTCRGVPDPVVMLGYWNRPDATAEKFTAEGWGRTGDLARFDADGNLWYQGRADDMFKSGGYRIGPAEIENCLLKHPAVAMAAVIGRPDEARGAVVVAYVVLQPGQTGDAALVEALQAHVRSQLASYEVPKAIRFVDSLPMTTTGKIQRRFLRERENTAGEAGSSHTG
jgi:acetyl-CoA synthetase